MVVGGDGGGGGPPLVLLLLTGNSVQYVLCHKCPANVHSPPHYMPLEFACLEVLGIRPVRPGNC